MVRNSLIFISVLATSYLEVHYRECYHHLIWVGQSSLWIPIWMSIVCLFVWGFVFHSRNFHSHGDVTITDGASNSDLYSAIMAIEQWGVLSVPYLLWHGSSVYNGHVRGPVTHTYCWAFGCGDVTTCFNDLGLSLPEIEPRSSACKANALSPSHNDSLHEASLRLAVP